MMKSSALLRTNVGLTTNIKFMVSTDYSLYLDSIVSTSELSDTKYKKLQFNKDNYWDELVPYFFKGTPANIGFKIKYDDDSDNMSQDFANQYDGLYTYGARNIVDNKDYSEEYEYFAPLYINKNNLPTNFIIFRIDGPGLLKLDKTNFRTEILNKLKFVKNFDLTTKTPLGEWMDKNIKNNKQYPDHSLYVDFRRLEFSSWIGIDYEDGGYSEKSFLLDSSFEYEQPYLEMENLIFNGFRNNKVVFPHIINFSFLFDDTPATPTSVRKWSLNRYLGFYLDELTLVKKVSPTILPRLRSDVEIDSKNIIYSPSNDSPFLDTWKKDEIPYVEINNVFYKVETFEEYTNQKLQKVLNSRRLYEDKITSKKVTKYKIIAPISLEGKKSVDMNVNLVSISTENSNKIVYQNGSNFDIPDYDSADVWIMQIGDHYHNIQKNVDGLLYLNTDYGFTQSAESFKYYINDSDPTMTKTLDLRISKSNKPVEFGIFKCKFTDIKDFDTDIINTDFSRFEYEKFGELTETDEPKMYTVDLDSFSQPKDLVEFRLANEVVNIPSSSEYTANSETFRIIDNQLSNLWRKNADRLKWGFERSISSYDYPYLLNNSISADEYNRTSNTSEVNVSRQLRNLDYFYSVNSEDASYKFQSLHINQLNDQGEIDTTFNFELDKHLGINYDYDYFLYFFGKKSYFQNAKLIEKSKKWSEFVSGDINIPNQTVFRGLKFSLYEIDNMSVKDSKIEKINLKNSNKFDNWKFSILLSENTHLITRDLVSNKSNIIEQKNLLKWRVIDNWKHDKEYQSNSLVLYNECLYTNGTNSVIKDPKLNPILDPSWTTYRKPTIFFGTSSNLGTTPSNNMKNFYNGFPALCYNYGEYYYSDNPESIRNFWLPSGEYLIDDVVIYKNKSWQSLTSSNTTIPDDRTTVIVDGQSYPTWTTKNIAPGNIWEIVELWRPEKDYSISTWNATYYQRGNYVLYDDVVYGTTNSNPKIGISPNLNSEWVRVYSVVPDTNYAYGLDLKTNGIIYLNDKYYECIGNNLTPGITDPNILYNISLDNGIYVIINEKHKNVLVNIYVNDNTYKEFIKDPLHEDFIYNLSKSYLSNVNRDDLYSKIFTKLSSNNLMNSLNDLSNKFGFSDFVKYVIVKQTGEIEMYDFGDLNYVKNLPYLLTCEPPDEFLVRTNSNEYKSVTLDSSEIKPRKVLDDSQINSLNQIDYYNNMHLGTEINRVKGDDVIIPNFSGLKNKIFYKIYRHSGYYEPILKSIELFDSPGITHSITNYKFDTDLTNFGICKERIISKVNSKQNILKLKNNPNLKSIYPMIDEHGYHIVNTFIFKSTWDHEYHYECMQSPKEQMIAVNEFVKPTFGLLNSNNSQNLL